MQFRFKRLENFLFYVPPIMYVFILLNITALDGFLLFA